MRNLLFAFAKSKAQMQLHSNPAARFCYTDSTLSFYFLEPKFQASCHLLWLYSPVCVGETPKTGFLMSAHMSVCVEALTSQSTIFQSCRDGATTSWALPVLKLSKVSCSRTQHSGGRFLTPDLSLQSLTLYQ